MEQTINQISLGSFRGAMVGVEKEGLRVRPDGRISHSPHPHIFGAALTHPCITTDFSEALLELITPPCTNSNDALAFLSDTETFVHQQLADEYLWASSMPCFLHDETDIPIAYYGNSDIGKMKTIYRRGLAHRYGKIMQVIAGIHFNYSLSERLLAELKIAEKSRSSASQYTNEKYMGLIRNIQRYGWLNLYLFGASPAICRSFLNSKPEKLNIFDHATYSHPYATSLRMSDIGYTNNRSNRIFDVSYNSLEAYIRTLGYLINTPNPAYALINNLSNDEPQQLNNNILQIENEYYATVRPKQVPRDGESHFRALQERGIRYVELRSLDINPFYPSGLRENQMYFLEVFMHYCLLKNSPAICQQEARWIDENQNRVAREGRNPQLYINRNGQNIKMMAWGLDVMDEMEIIAGTLDTAHDTVRYKRALTEQRQKILNPELTPSARVLREMYQNRESFTEFTFRKSVEHHEYYKEKLLSDGRRRYYEYVSRKSHRQLHKMETCDNTRELINRLILNEVAV